MLFVSGHGGTCKTFAEGKNVDFKCLMEVPDGFFLTGLVLFYPGKPP